MSHSLIRTIAPSGHLHTFEFHSERAETARLAASVVLTVYVILWFTYVRKGANSQEDKTFIVGNVNHYIPNFACFSIIVLFINMQPLPK